MSFKFVLILFLFLTMGYSVLAEERIMLLDKRVTVGDRLLLRCCPDKLLNTKKEFWVEYVLAGIDPAGEAINLKGKGEDSRVNFWHSIKTFPESFDIVEILPPLPKE